MINNGPIQSGSSDQWSGIGQVISDTHPFKQLLFCDPAGNRGFFNNDYGIMFTHNQKTVVVTAQANYVFKPETWAFVDIETEEVAPLFISLDSVSQGHHAFSDPQANVTIVENVQEHLVETIIENHKLVVDYAIHDSIVVHSTSNKLTMEEILGKLTKNMEKSLYEPIPKVQNYAD